MLTWERSMIEFLESHHQSEPSRLTLNKTISNIPMTTPMLNSLKVPEYKTSLNHQVQHTAFLVKKATWLAEPSCLGALFQGQGYKNPSKKGKEVKRRKL